MLGLLLNFLPFWVREPLFIALGIPFSGFLFYTAASDGRPVMALLGLVVLAFTAVRVHSVVHALADPPPGQGGGSRVTRRRPPREIGRRTPGWTSAR